MNEGMTGEEATEYLLGPSAEAPPFEELLAVFNEVGRLQRLLE